MYFKRAFWENKLKKFISFLFLKYVTRAFIVKRAFKAFEKMQAKPVNDDGE